MQEEKNESIIAGKSAVSALTVRWLSIIKNPGPCSILLPSGEELYPGAYPEAAPNINEP